MPEILATATPKCISLPSVRSGFHWLRWCWIWWLGICQVPCSCPRAGWSVSCAPQHKTSNLYLTRLSSSKKVSINTCNCPKHFVILSSPFKSPRVSFLCCGRFVSCYHLYLQANCDGQDHPASVPNQVSPGSELQLWLLQITCLQAFDGGRDS